MSITHIPEANKCPCCGWEAELITKYVSYGYEYSIECSSCLFSIGWHQSKEVALAVWNNVENEKDDEEETSEVAMLKAQIEQLERQNAELAARIELGKVLEEQLKRERDAAISDLKDVIEVADGVNYCQYCKHNDDDGQCHHPCNPYAGESGWEWRGAPQEGEHE